MNHAQPGSAAPPLSFHLTDGRQFILGDQQPDSFAMLVIYRHSQCSICNGYLKLLDALSAQFSAAGVDIIAASVDSAEATREMVDVLDLKKLTIGHGLPLAMAADWGLFISAKRKDTEPERFFEPALFLIDPDGLVYYAAIQSMPFGRPPLDEILRWIPKISGNKIPARGEVSTI